MNRFSSLTLLVFAFSLSLFSGCATVHLDMTKIQKDFTDAVQKADSAEQKSRTDFAEKKSLVESLKKSGKPGFKPIASKVQEYLGTMTDSLKVMGDRRKAMMKANAQLSSIAYSFPKLNEGQPQYAQAETLTKDFEAAAQDVNKAILDYSTASNSMADLVADKKLFMNFDVADFYTRLQKEVQSAQNRRIDMQEGLDNIEAGNEASGKSLTELEGIATSYMEKAQGFSKISKQMDAIAMGATKISNLEPRWSSVQKLNGDLESLVHELAAIFEQFNRGLQDFKAK